jgi:hypothetical protein
VVAVLDVADCGNRHKAMIPTAAAPNVIRHKVSCMRWAFVTPAACPDASGPVASAAIKFVVDTKTARIAAARARMAIQILFINCT